MKLTCQSEYGAIKSVFIKNAEAAFVSEENLTKEWKPLNFLSKPDLSTAFSEYQGFIKLLGGDGAELMPFPKDASVSIDSIYCRDASIATDHGMILCNMGKSNRLTEPEAQGKAFEKLNINILGSIRKPGSVEGGDVAWLDEKTLAVGLTYRTNKSGIQQLAALLNLVDSKAINLNTGRSTLDGRAGATTPGAAPGGRVSGRFVVPPRGQTP